MPQSFVFVSRIVQFASVMTNEESMTNYRIHSVRNSMLALLLVPVSSVLGAEVCDTSWYSGEGTQYGGVAGSDGGNCGIYVDSADYHHCAMNQIQYDSSAACGACVRILGPRGEITLKVVDRCPECKYGDIDMATHAFTDIAELSDGRIPIRWQYVPCDMPTGSDIKVVFAAGSSPYYFKAQFRNFRYALAKVEYRRTDGSYSVLHREMYNYYVENGGIDEDKTKTGPYTFRLTAKSGEQVVIENVPYEPSVEIGTGVQFAATTCPDCAGVAGGKARIDNCGVCSGGSTGVEVNSACVADCKGYWRGTAYLDSCGLCVGGTTGGTPCNEVYNGVQSLPSSSAVLLYIEVYDMWGRYLGRVADEAGLLSAGRFGQRMLLLLVHTDQGVVARKFVCSSFLFLSSLAKKGSERRQR
jgi:expansin (peptidoglycan-binding protein)